MGCTDAVQLGDLMCLHIRSRRIVRMHHEHRTAPVAGLTRNFDSPMQRVEIDLPSMVVYQFIRNEFHILQICEKVEQRVAWGWYQHDVSGIAEQPKNERVAFAGAGGKNQIV